MRELRRRHLNRAGRPVWTLPRRQGQPRCARENVFRYTVDLPTGSRLKVFPRHPAVVQGASHESRERRKQGLRLLQMRRLQVRRVPLLQMQRMQLREQVRERGRKAPFLPVRAEITQAVEANSRQAENQRTLSCLAFAQRISDPDCCQAPSGSSARLTYCAIHSTV